MDLDSLTALSPVDGRYAQAADSLRQFMSEGALIRERIRVEAAWLLALTTEVPQVLRAPLAPTVIDRARAMATDPDTAAALEVKAIERRINHDVKAVEYYVRDQLEQAGAGPAVLELVHFGCTSEDINNLAYATMLYRARTAMLDRLEQLITTLRALAHNYADVAMLARTHGQTASPTTLGKEFANVVARLERAHRRWRSVELLGKWNGAVGNYNAQVAAFPEVDWRGVSRRLVESLGLGWNEYTTQIEPHDCVAEYADALAAANVVLIDLARDIWGYVSLGYLRQRAIAGEVGSSTMPHKVNPINFENAEGNLGVANALLRHFADKLPVSRWQRDLTDSTVLRNVGVALAHTQIAWASFASGLSKIEADVERIDADLAGAHEVLGEAIQTVLRAAGVPNGYETLKAFTRGRRIDAAMLDEFIASLPLPPTERQRLAGMRPADYVGLAAALARAI